MSDYEQPTSFEDSPGSHPLGSPASRNSAGQASADANVTLWQFLLDLLLKQQYNNIIRWTNNEGEFKLLDAEQVAKLWGLKKNKHNMNYDKLSRALRYYYDKNIIKKVMGQKFVYKFVSFPEMVKTENRIPFKKKMESIVNECGPASSGEDDSPAAGFQSMRPYDIKSGLIHQAHIAAALSAQHQVMQQHAAMIKQEYQSAAECQSMYRLAQPSKMSPVPMATDLSMSCRRSRSRSPTPKHAMSAPGSNKPSHPSPLAKRPSPDSSPVSVCSPERSPSPAPVFELPVSHTPTPPPKTATPIRSKEPEVKVKLEIPELHDSGVTPCSENVSAETKKPTKHIKKPNPISINNDVATNPSATSPQINRMNLPSLNTPMFLTSPMFGQRTPLIPGIHFWTPGTLSPVSTLSPRLHGGLTASPAFQFPAFAVSPATLSSFTNFTDVFLPTPNPVTGDKKVSMP